MNKIKRHIRLFFASVWVAKLPAAGSFGIYELVRAGGDWTNPISSGVFPPIVTLFGSGGFLVWALIYTTEALPSAWDRAKADNVLRWRKQDVRAIPQDNLVKIEKRIRTDGFGPLAVSEVSRWGTFDAETENEEAWEFSQQLKAEEASLTTAPAKALARAINGD